MTVHTLEAARKTVHESPDLISGIYEYVHAVTGKNLWSIETWMNQGSTLRSPMCLYAKLVYDGYEQEWLGEDGNAVSS